MLAYVSAVHTDDHDPRGVAARTFLSEDSRWWADAALSAKNDTDRGGWLNLTLLGHGARIAYEGAKALRSPNPAVGIPELAAELTHRHGDVVARARHAGKLLDDTKKSFEQLHREMAEFYAAHQGEFLGNAPAPLRWLETDLGLCLTIDRRILFSTIVGQFRIGFASHTRIGSAGPVAFGVGHDLGLIHALLSTANGNPEPVDATIDYGILGRLRARDRRAATFLAGRYDSTMSIETKLLLLMVEGEAATTHTILPLTAFGHEEAVFRARLVSTFHAVRAVEEALNRHPATRSDGADAARDLLADPETRLLLDFPGMRQLRNRSVHYEIRSADLRLDPMKPMFGMVEALNPGRSYAEIDGVVRMIARRLADLLRDW